MLQCNHLTIEESNHKAIQQIQASQHLYQFLHLERNSPLLTLSESQHIAWPLTFNMLNYNHSLNNHSSTSFGQHKWCVFKFKLFSNKLLTLSYLKLQRPNLYLSDTWGECCKKGPNWKFYQKFFYKWNSCKFNHLIQNIHYFKKKFFYNLVSFHSTYPTCLLCQSTQETP